MSRPTEIRDGRWQFVKARGKKHNHVHGAMNKGEQSYAAYLEVRKIAGEIAWYGFESIKLKLADNTFFTPDFAVMDTAGYIELIDVKGRTTYKDANGLKKEKAFSMEDARLKVKIAAAQYPMFTFKTAFPSKETGGWMTEEF
jgi:hypothetical protein